jgi:hypothetical protein
MLNHEIVADPFQTGNETSFTTHVYSRVSELTYLLALPGYYTSALPSRVDG